MPTGNEASIAQSDHESELIRLAKLAARAAYAPYSNFAVGCALLGDNKKYYSGCNVENASYGLTICAERSAIVAGVSDGMKRIEKLLIYTSTANPVAPCGSCRQFMYEFAAENLETICVSHAPQPLRFQAISELLPFGFGPMDLK